jgi:predicted NAD/FAD-dependent oxidoreductase
MSNFDSNKRVAVIGAGLAGLSCANQLKADGFQVQLFEKSRGSSGRMSTRKGDGWSADHGAQYFTARSPLFVEELNSWIGAGVAGAWHPTLKVFEDNQWRDGSVTENRYVGIPGMNSPGQYLAKNLSIEFNQTIDQISHQNSKWSLHSIESGSIEDQFDWLVIALPAPQAFILTKFVDQSIEESSRSFNMFGCWTVMVRFTEKPDVSFDAAFINDEIISWVSRNISKPGRTGQESWTIQANPQWSQDWIELDKEEASKRILECAKKLGFNFQNAEISIHRWRYASGAISPIPEFSFFENMNLGLCGDWLHGGRVEGAWLSGLKLSNEIKMRAVKVV